MVDDRYRRRDEHDDDRERYADSPARHGEDRDARFDPRHGGSAGRGLTGVHSPEDYRDAPRGGRSRRAGGDLYGRDRYPGNSSREGYAGHTGYDPDYVGEADRFGGRDQRFAGGIDDYGRDLEHQAYGPNPRIAPGEHRGRGPRGYRRSDERIREDVNDRLSDDGFVDASDIEVTVSNGEVTLSGTVSNRAQKRRAEDIADMVSAVSNVQNNIRVAQGGGMPGASASASGGTAGTSARPGDPHAPQASHKT